MGDLRDLAFTLCLESILSPEEIRDLPGSTDPWSTLAYTIDCASKGDFSATAKVPELLRNVDGALFWSAATTFIGMAGSRTIIQEVLSAIRSSDQGGQYYGSTMLGYSCDLSHVPILLDWYEKTSHAEVRNAVATNLSLLLEPTPGRICLGAAERDKYGDPQDTEEDASDIPDYASMPFDELFAKVIQYEDYRRMVTARVEELCSTHQTQGLAIFAGDALDAHRIAAELALAQDAIFTHAYSALRLLEGMTGIFASPWRESDTLEPDIIRAFLAKLSTSHVLASLRRGQRYFFGHAVPR